MSMLDAALEYADRGYYVLACQPLGKLPATEHGLHDATTDEKAIRQWWTATPDANIGMALDNLAGTTVQGLALRSRLIPFEGVAELKLAIDKKDVEVFYVCEGLDPYLDAILKLSRDLKVLSVAGNEAMVHHGVALGIVLSAGSRGTIVVNLRIARSEGANFGSDLLRVARVIR